jgi:ABC-2 type transport system permease protein
MTRVLPLLRKELLEVRANRAIFVPAILTASLAMLLPFFVAIIVPAVAGERLSDSSDFEVAIKTYSNHPVLRGLDPEGAIQAWVFEQFLVLLILAPIATAMSVAAYSVIGEKQARTLEPLLATPLTTTELLAAKVLGAMLPTLALTVGCFVVYAAGIAAFARAGVYLVLLTPSALSIMFLIGPLASLAALQLAVCVSSRVNDPRSAQQIGALVVLPVAGLLVVQLTGAFQLDVRAIGGLALALVAGNAGLMLLATALFDREAILTRWK